MRAAEVGPTVLLFLAGTASAEAPVELAIARASIRWRLINLALRDAGPTRTTRFAA